MSCSKKSVYALIGLLWSGTSAPGELMNGVAMWQFAQPMLIAVTGYGQPEDEQRAQAAGFDAHLVKPADLAKLRALLARGRDKRA